MVSHVTLLPFCGRVRSASTWKVHVKDHDDGDDDGDHDDDDDDKKRMK